MSGVIRALLTVLPLLTVLVVFGLVFGPGAPRPLVSAKLWGGPTDRLARFSGWVEVSAEGAPLSRAVHVRARDEHGARADADVHLDADGRGELALNFPTPPGTFDVELALGERSLGHGAVKLSQQQWLSAHRRGGFSPARAQGPLSVVVAPLRGAFAVPFAGTLLVRVERAGTPLSGATLALSSEGAVLAASRAQTDARGLAAVKLTPREHIVTLRVAVNASDGARAELFTTVPVVPGAMVAERRGDELVISAPSSRTVADVSLVSEAGRLFGARVPLNPDGEIARGTLALPVLGPEPVWAVTASDAAAPSPATIGWPLFDSNQSPALTFDASDVLLLDTAPQAARAEHQRRATVRQWAVAIGLLGAIASVAAFVVTTISQRKVGRDRLSDALDGELAESILPQQSGRALLAIVLIITGFFVVVLILAWRLR